VARTSRRRLAEYVAERLLADDVSVIAELAALIVTERREREIELIVRDIEDSLARRGVLVATVETATQLTDSVRAEIVKLLDASEVKLREIVAPELIGGVRVRTPGAVLDGTIVQKLHTLKSKKI
jgi:F0F1-type ATP synthase delta subunit